MKLTQAKRHKFLSWIYLGTPVFLLIDLLFDLNIRVVGLEEPIYKFTYLGFCFAIGLIGQKNQFLGAAFSLFESCLSIALICISVFLSVSSHFDALLGGINVRFQFGLPEVLNLLISSTIFIIAFYKNPLIKMGQDASFEEVLVNTDQE